MRYLIAVAGATLSACQGDVPRERTQERQATSAAECGDAVVTGAGVGALRIGARVDSVRARCRVVRDTVELRAEGLPSRVVTMMVGDDTVAAEVDSGRVWRIEVTRSSPRTADSLGVGTPLTQLLALPEVRAASGEGGVYVLSNARCGLSFELSGHGPGGLRAEWDIAALRRFPPSTVVTRVLVVGCAAGS